MLPKPTDSEKLFAKVLNVLIKENFSNQARTSPLLLTVEWQPSPSVVHKQELVVHLTDENDPFFLYTLNLNEDDFQNLKVQQGLLVDFHTLPQRFIELLNICLEEQQKSQPRFVLVINIQKFETSASPAELNIVETNPFKHLTHLSLKLVAASDSLVRKYLTCAFEKLKSENGQLKNTLEFVEKDLKTKVTSSQENLKSKTQELELVRKELNVELSHKDSRHSIELQEERERLLKIQKDEELKWDNERREKDHNHRKQVQQLEARISSLDSLNKEYQEKHYKSDANVRELRTRLLSLEEEVKQAHQRLNNCGKDKNSLEVEMTEKRQAVNRLKLRVGNLEQDIAEKEQMIIRLQEQMEIFKLKLQKSEKDCTEKQTVLEKRDKMLRTLSEDISKANEIIRKLQVEVRSSHDKLKIRGKIAVKQEQVITEKDNKLQSFHEDICSLQMKLKEKEDRNKILNETVCSLESKITDYETQVKTHENVIKWLNRQLNELQFNHNKSSAIDPASNVIQLKQPVYHVPPVTHASAMSKISAGISGLSYTPLVKTVTTSTPFLVGNRSLGHTVSHGKSGNSPLNLGYSSTGYSNNSPVDSQALDSKYLPKNINYTQLHNASHLGNTPKDNADILSATHSTTKPVTPTTS